MPLVAARTVYVLGIGLPIALHKLKTWINIQPAALGDDQHGELFGTFNTMILSNLALTLGALLAAAIFSEGAILGNFINWLVLAISVSVPMVVFPYIFLNRMARDTRSRGLESLQKEIDEMEPDSFADLARYNRLSHQLLMVKIHSGRVLHAPALLKLVVIVTLELLLATTPGAF